MVETAPTRDGLGTDQQPHGGQRDGQDRADNPEKAELKRRAKLEGGDRGDAERAGIAPPAEVKRYACPPVADRDQRREREPPQAAPPKQQSADRADSLRDDADRSTAVRTASFDGSVIATMRALGSMPRWPRTA